MTIASAVKWWGYLFKGAMVRAILDDSKTMTRRLPSPHNTAIGSAPKEFWKHADFSKAWVDGKGTNEEYLHVPAHDIPCARCREMGWDGTVHRFYYRHKPGDRIWVKETWAPWTKTPGKKVIYNADNPLSVFGKPLGGPWKSSMFMPRWASRINLEIVKVRVERLQDISEEDAFAEGCPKELLLTMGSFSLKPVEWYRGLWEEINGPKSWDANPLVWVVEFKRV